MRRLLVMLAAIAALVACQNSVSTTPDKPATQSKEPAKAKAVAKIGDTITLKGNDSGEQVAVTLLRIVPAAKGADEFDQPEKGKQWFAAQFLLKDTGKTPYDDSPSNGTVVVDSQSQQYQATFADKIKQGVIFPGGVKIPVGGQAKGFVVYEVPKGTKIVQVQFGIDSGFGSTGQWNIG